MTELGGRPASWVGSTEAGVQWAAPCLWECCLGRTAPSPLWCQLRAHPEEQGTQGSWRVILVHFNEAGGEKVKQVGREKDTTVKRAMRPEDLERAAAPASSPGNPMDRGAWWAAVYGVAKSRTRLSDSTSTNNKATGRDRNCSEPTRSKMEDLTSRAPSASVRA